MKTKPSLHITSMFMLGLLASITDIEAAQGPQPNICTRACWGARNTSCSGTMGSLSRAIIHHTAGPADWTTDYEAGKARVRSNQNYHMDSNGWCDIGYHFLVNAAGHIYEGRKNSMGGLPTGAHDACNANSFGFNVLGYFHPPYNHTFTSAAQAGLEAVIAWRMPSAWSATGSGSYCSATVGTLDGHYKVKSTACPGEKIIPSIPAIRNGVMSRKNGGTPAPTSKVYNWQADFDGDGKADAAVWRPSNGTWYISGSAAGYWTVPSFGFPTDVPVPADYDGDGKHDAAIWRPSNGYWYIRGSTVGYWEVPSYGFPTDVPVPADYDGDGKADVAVWRPSNGTWYFRGSTGYIWNVQRGASGDLPVPADYDGDGKADAAVWRPSNGDWYIGGSGSGNWTVPSFGFPTDVPYPADYDGDGKADAAVWRPSNGYWYFRGTLAGYWEKPSFGFATDIPVPADYDGDNKVDAAVWRPSNGTWYIHGTTGFMGQVPFGTPEDKPL